MENKKKILIILLITILTLILGGVSIYLYTQEESTNFDALDQMEESMNSTVDDVENINEIEEETVNTEVIIAVHIAGEVKKPGIIYLKEGSRIADAIEEAGGTTKNANLDRVNLAYVLSDGQKIYIPNKNEKDEAKEYIISSSGENILLEESSIKKGESGKVNINSASQTELETLPGIGPSLAQRIIQYREANGEFQKVEDLQNVKGIGDSKYSNIKDNVCI